MTSYHNPTPPHFRPSPCPPNQLSNGNTDAYDPKLGAGQAPIIDHPLTDTSPSTEDGDDLCSLYSNGSSKYTDSLPSPSMNKYYLSSERRRFLNPPNDTVAELMPEEVRWFYRDEADKRWLPFIGYDSLRIETKFRELREHGPEGGAQNEKIIVRGGLFEVDVLSRQCFPIYWTATNQTSSVTRGIWFRETSWQPLPEDIAEQVEQEHLAKFEGQPVKYEPPPPPPPPTANDKDSSTPPPPAEKSRKHVAINTLRFSDCHVDWYTVDDVNLYQDSAALFIRQKLGMQKVGAKLRRGFQSPAGMEDKPPDITHLCFVIHGIGQKMRTGAIIKSCSDLSKICNQLKVRYFPDLDAGNQRVEFLPVEWRTSLRLDGDTVDSITPTNMRGLRTLLNSSAMDILYYTSPLYRSEITHGLQSELNRLYSMFCARHPYFEANGGRVSIIAHSLGSVITYDIIMGWNPIQLYDQYFQSAMTEKSQDIVECQQLMAELEEARKRVSDLELSLLTMAEREHMKIPTLSFRLENFFCLGSPLAVFLALRGVRPKGSGSHEHFLPRSVCSRIFNIYHPADPVAYRLEPLVLKSYTSVHALRIHRFDSLNKAPYDASPLQPIVSGSKKQFTTPATEQKPVPEAATCTAELRSQDDFGAIYAERTRRASGGEDDQASERMTDDDQPTNNDKGQPPTLSKRLSFFFSRRKDASDPDADSTHSSPMATRRVAVAPPLQASSCSELKDLGQPAGRPLPSDLEEALASLNKECSAPSDSSSSTTRIPSPACPAADAYAGMLESTDLEHRIDFQLQESRYESSYLSVLTSHTSYWTNQDVAMFVMTHLFPEYGPIGIPK